MAFNFTPEDLRDERRMINLVQEVPDDEFDNINKQVNVFDNDYVVEYVVKKVKYIGPEPLLKCARNMNELWKNNEELREIILYSFDYNTIYSFYGSVNDFNEILSYYKKLRPEDNHPFGDNESWEVYMFDNEDELDQAYAYFRYKHGYIIQGYEVEFYEDKYNY
jgi:hypothetical protein